MSSDINSRYGTGNREQEIASISRALKNIAKELNIPVIALSQLSRAVEHRGGPKRPQLADLRESGSIEQDADIVIFLYRPEIYGITEDESGNSTAGLADVIVAKHRNGRTGEMKLRFIDKFTKFDNCEYNVMEDDIYSDISIVPKSTIIRKSKINEEKEEMEDPKNIPF